MDMTSAAEAKLEARVRPEISALHARILRPAPGMAYRNPDQPAPDRPVRPAGRTPVRLTRRGRVVIGAIAAIATAAVASVIWLALAGRARAASQASSGVPVRATMERVVVQPGQTLWAIAVKADPAADPRLIIPRIMTINGLRETAIGVGQVLWVPRG